MSKKGNTFRSQRNVEISHIMREQIELLKTEKELGSMIEKINNQLNQLLVEELQLKSNEISKDINLIPPERKPTLKEIEATLDSMNINKQTLNLMPSHQLTIGEEEEEDSE